MITRKQLIELALKEDVGAGDHTSLACISPQAKGKAVLLVKAGGILAGVDVAQEVFQCVDATLQLNTFMKNGDACSPGDIAFEITGSAQSILTGERLCLNLMQRMSGIATLTSKYVKACAGTTTRVLDTRKTTPGIRVFEKQAVKIGGGENHRFGLDDYIMLKDNHIDYAGGIPQAIFRVKEYLKKNRLKLQVEIETRNLDEVNQVLKTGHVNRIMLDNFTPEQTREAVKLINGQYETESSGGITLNSIGQYATCGVDYISVGALTHSAVSLDLSLKADIAK